MAKVEAESSDPGLSILSSVFEAHSIQWISFAFVAWIKDSHNFSRPFSLGFRHRFSEHDACSGKQIGSNPADLSLAFTNSLKRQMDSIVSQNLLAFWFQKNEKKVGGSQLEEFSNRDRQAYRLVGHLGFLSVSSKMHRHWS